MARRDLEVRVRADVGAYQKAMSAAVASTDQLGQAGLRLQKLGLSVSNLGDTLTKNVTLPLVAVGAVATKAALDFDKSFTTMQTLAGVSASEVDHLKESVLDLAGETGRAPQELAEALYFLQSSGLDSAQAMEALEVSAKASAAGLGDTRSIADAVSSAMLGYAKSGLTAAEATDVLVATAREGKAEPAELAAQMGRLIPIASELGITFGDVGGAIAALSTKGFNAEQATTALVNVMGKLLKPSEQAKQLLEEVGLSTDTIRQSIADKGLLATLEELRAKLGENGFVKFLEDQQAVQGGLALLGGDLNKTKEIFEEVNGSVGATENAFSTWAESMGAENAQAFAQFQVALINLGDVLAPIATDVISALSGIAEAFSNLPSGVQQAIIYAALFAAALGPILSIGGRVITVIGTISRILPELVAPAGTVSGAFNGAAISTSRFAGALATLGKVGLVVGALIALREVLGTIDDEIEKADLSELENQLLDLAEKGKVSGDTLKRVFEGIGDGASTIDAKQLGSDLEQVDEALAKLAARDPDAAADAFRRISEALREQDISASLIEESFDAYRGALAEADTASRTTSGAIEEADAAMEELGLETGNTVSELEKLTNALKAQFDPQFAMIDAMQQNAAAQQELRDATAALNEARASGDVEAITEAENRYNEAVNGARTSVVDLQVAANQLKDAMAQQGLTADQVTAKFVDLAVQQGFTQEEALVMAEAFGIATGKADELGRTDPNVAVTETGNVPVQDQLHRTQNEAFGIPTGRNVDVTSSGTGSTISNLAAVTSAVNDIPHSKTVQIAFQVYGQAELNRALALSGRQHGGPVLAGEAYIVGESGPEVLLMGAQSGHIIPNGGWGTPLSNGSMGNWGGGAGGGSYVDNRTINVYSGADPQGVVEAIKRYERSNGPGWRN